MRMALFGENIVVRTVSKRLIYRKTTEQNKHNFVSRQFIVESLLLLYCVIRLTWWMYQRYNCMGNK